MGIVSCLGNDLATIARNLYEGNSGISLSADMVEYGFRSQAEGRPPEVTEYLPDRKTARFLGPGSHWNYSAMTAAIEDAGLQPVDYFHQPRTGIIMGSGGPSTSEIVKAAEITKRNVSPKKIGPFTVPKTMCSTASASLAVPFGIQGVNFSPSAACATSTICIGEAYEKIHNGRQDIIFAGGSEELHWTLSNAFDAMGAMSSKYNANPETASRAYDQDRDGFVIAGGAGVLVLEEYEHALLRGAKIYGEVIGYGQTSDGVDMVAPSGEGAVRCMESAMEWLSPDEAIDYVNAHATSTPAGDVVELKSISEAFDFFKHNTLISGTKCLSGHSLGAAGVQEAIYTLLMMQGNFVSPNINVDNLDPEILDIPFMDEALVLGEAKQKDIQIAMTNNFGFGGVNATLIFKKV